MDDQVTPRDEAQQKNTDTEHELWLRMGNPKLAALRAQWPFVPIAQMPNVTLSATLAAGVATDVNIPEGTKVIYVWASDRVYFSRNGNAALPPAADFSQSQGMGIAYLTGQFIYVEETKQLSVIAKNAATDVVISCYAQV